VPGARCWVHVEHLLVAGRYAELVVVVDPWRLEALVPQLLAVALLAARGEDAPATRLERERGVEAAARRAARDQDRAALVGHAFNTDTSFLCSRPRRHVWGGSPDFESAASRAM
jgi:hypothetical protein